MPFLRISIFSFIAFLIFSCSKSENRKAWKGSAIIGNGEVCSVYSDDDRLSKTGIQHFYYKENRIGDIWDICAGTGGGQGAPFLGWVMVEVYPNIARFYFYRDNDQDGVYDDLHDVWETAG